MRGGVQSAAFRSRAVSAPNEHPFLPEFLRRLAGEDVRRVFLAGCGGGFDFVHGMLLYPALRALGKEVVVGSYSFGDPGAIGGEAPVVFSQGDAVVKRVTATSTPDPHYAPEVHLCRFLDERYPGSTPHFVYAYYARDFSVPLLSAFYRQVVRDHSVDAVVVVDGGSDSLMRGDEEGLGDPVEDCVSVTTLADLEAPAVRLLVTVGLGCDRHNEIADAASLRAIAELTRAGGFLGALSLEPAHASVRFYRDCLDAIYRHQSFRSVVAGSIVAASDGFYGTGDVPEVLRERVAAGQLFLWPLMAVLWGFDPRTVAERSLLSAWIRDAQTCGECYRAVRKGRAGIAPSLRGPEELPRHADLRGGFNFWDPANGGG